MMTVNSKQSLIQNRKREPLRRNGRMIYAGIDLGGTAVKAGLVSENGEIIARNHRYSRYIPQRSPGETGTKGSFAASCGERCSAAVQPENSTGITRVMIWFFSSVCHASSRCENCRFSAIFGSALKREIL